MGFSAVAPKKVREVNHRGRTVIATRPAQNTTDKTKAVAVAQSASAIRYVEEVITPEVAATRLAQMRAEETTLRQRSLDRIVF